MTTKVLFFKAWVKPFSYINKNGKNVDVPGYNRRNKHPTTSKSLDDWIVEEYKKGRSCPEIAKEVGRSTSKIWTIVSAASAIRPHGEAMALRLKNMPSLSEHRGKQLAFHSEKNNCWIPAGSRYEYIRMEQLENDKSVISFDRCADRIKYEIDGSSRYYIPDIEVIRADGITVEEIKPEAYLDDPAVVAKRSAAESFYSGIGKKYRIVTENGIGADVIKKFDWSGIAGIPDIERDEKERARQRKVKKERYQNLSSDQREVEKEKMREYHQKKMSEITDEEMAERRRKNSEAQRKSRERKIVFAKSA